MRFGHLKEICAGNNVSSDSSAYMRLLCFVVVVLVVCLFVLYCFFGFCAFGVGGRCSSPLPPPPSWSSLSLCFLGLIRLQGGAKFEHCFLQSCSSMFCLLRGRPPGCHCDATGPTNIFRGKCENFRSEG